MFAPAGPCWPGRRRDKLDSAIPLAVGRGIRIRQQWPRCRRGAAAALAASIPARTARRIAAPAQALSFGRSCCAAVAGIVRCSVSRGSDSDTDRGCSNNRAPTEY